MSTALKLKRSFSDERVSPSVATKFIPNLSQEIFRNDTTAVEVIVKQTNTKNNKRTHGANTTFDNDKIKKFAKDLESLKFQLNEANKNLDDMKKKFRIVMYEMQKQLEAAYHRELKRQTKVLVMQIEKEKCKVLMESKSNIITKLRKELLCMRRILKIMVKTIRCTPKLSDTLMSKSDTENEDDLDKDTFESKIHNNGVTFEGILSSKNY